MNWTVMSFVRRGLVMARKPLCRWFSPLGLVRRLSWVILLPVLCPLVAHSANETTGATPPARASETNLEARFAHPPAEHRILKIIHGWPDAPEAQDGLIRSLLGQGFGGVVCNVSFQDYLESEAKWQAFVRAVTAARQAGMRLWLYDEKGYPSAAAGGLVLRDHPEWEAEGLLVAEARSRGGEVHLALPPGDVFLVAAYPAGGRWGPEQALDLRPAVHAGQLRWQAPAGHWRVLGITKSRLYEGTHAALSLADKLPYPNLLRPEPTARFLELTHQRYAERLGTDLGKWFEAAFTDEPSLMSMFLKPMPWRVLPWAPNLPAEFKKRRGYALEPIVPWLATDGGGEARRARYDFWLTIGELTSENFFGQLQAWCRRHGFPSGGHLLMEEGLLTHVPLYGDFFRCIRRLDAPSIDCLTSVPNEVPWFIARLLSSAAELEGRTLTMSETSDHSQRYRPAGDTRPQRTVSEAEIRGACNRLFAGGINTITSYYSFADLSDAQLRRLNDWVGRCSLLLRGGHQVADLAVLYPVESLWPNFVPARHYANASPAAARIENLYRTVADSLFLARRDFTFVDSRALAEAKVRDGALVHGDLRWRVVVLPGADTLPWAAWANLERFVKAGGVLVAVGALPANSEDEFPSSRVQKLASRMLGFGTAGPRLARNSNGGAGIFLPQGTEGWLPRLLDRILEAELKLAAGPAPLRVTHRRIDRHDVMLVINDEAQPWDGILTVPATGAVEEWNPATGSVVTRTRGDGLAVRLEPFGALLFRFAGARPSRRLELRDAVLPQLEVRPLPCGEPTVARGEFVRAQLDRDAVGTETQAVWRATATLTKSDVDTFLFLRFPCDPPADLSQAECVLVDTWTPDEQQTANQLLVILHEKSGADYLAATGRMLGQGGHERTHLPLSRFQLAGWSQDANARLDAAEIAEVRIGWGGYLGSEGEQVQFSAAAPSMGLLRP